MIGIRYEQRSRICNLMRRLRFQVAVTIGNNAHATLKVGPAGILLYKRIVTFGVFLSAFCAMRKHSSQAMAYVELIDRSTLDNHLDVSSPLQRYSNRNAVREKVTGG